LRPAAAYQVRLHAGTPASLKRALTFASAARQPLPLRVRLCSRALAFAFTLVQTLTYMYVNKK
jgi:hypothetical protein